MNNVNELLEKWAVKYGSESNHTRPIEQRELYEKYTFSEGPQYLYVFYNPITNLYKVGITKDPEERIRKLSCQAGVKLISVFEKWQEPDFDFKPKLMESFIHDIFKNNKKEGEWFQLSSRELVQLRRFLWDTDEGLSYDYFINSKYKQYE